MKYIFALLILLSFSPVMAQDDTLNWKPAAVGIGLVLAPLALTTDGLSVGHAWELEGFSFAETTIFGLFLPKDLRWLSPIVCMAVNGVYRLSEFNGSNNVLIQRKMACDYLGIASAVLAQTDVFLIKF